jgi:hypothetical protein
LLQHGFSIGGPLAASDPGGEDLDALGLALGRDALSGREHRHAVQRAPGDLGGQRGLFRLLGWFMLAATLIPVGDALIVMRSKGPKVAVYGIHGATALIMAIIVVLLLAG